MIRDRSGVERLAQQAFSQWTKMVVESSETYAWDKYERWEYWPALADEARQLYISQFIGAYLYKIQELDEQEAAKKRPTPPPQPAAQPAANTTGATNKATLKGATITLKDVKHEGNECVYTLEVVDPAYIDGPYEEKWVIVLGEAQDTSLQQRSLYQQGTPSKRPVRSYWKK